MGAGFNRLDFLTNEGSAMVSIGRDNMPGSSVVPAKVFGELFVTAENTYRKEGQKPLTPYMANGAIHSEMGREAKISNRTYLTESINHNVKGLVDTPIVGYSVAQVLNYVEYDRVDKDPGKPGLHPFMKPILKYGAYTPNATKGNSKWAVEERMTKFQKRDIPDLSLIDRKNVYQFIEQFKVHMDGPVTPTDISQVHERMNRPTQRSQNERAENTLGEPSNEATTFNKREAYQDVKDPRIITQTEPRQKVDYATYMYALGDVLKTMDWYCSAKTPREISERFAAVCHSAREFMSLDDFKRMDGTKSRKLREEFDEPFLRTIFAECSVDGLIKVFRQGMNCVAKDKFGQKCNTEYCQLSGSMDTAVMNALHNAFICFCGYMIMGMTPEEAWDSLGAYCGDDGGSADLDPAAHAKAAKRWGFILESNIINRGEPGVNFLARYYSPLVWYGDPSSMCDVRRQLAKFHLSTTSHPDNRRKLSYLGDKAVAYWLTDANTPYIGDFTAKVLALSDYGEREAGGDLASHSGVWWARWDKDSQWPNRNDGGWMEAQCEMLMPGVMSRAEFIRRLHEIRSCSAFLDVDTLTIWEQLEPRPGKRDAAVVNAESHGTAKIEARDEKSTGTPPDKGKEKVQGSRGSKDQKKPKSNSQRPRKGRKRNAQRGNKTKKK
jgi:hypothetical protein